MEGPREHPCCLIISGMFTLLMQAGVKRSQLCMRHPKQEPHVPGLVLSFSLSYTDFPPSCCSLSPAPHPGKNHGSSKIQKHMWLAIKLHMHSVKTMGEGGSNIRQQSELTGSEKNKDVRRGGRRRDNGDSQREGDCRLPFQHGPRTMPALWLGGAAPRTR